MGLIRKIKLASGINNYNEDDVQKILADREKNNDDQKIVLINPATQSIEKTFNNINIQLYSIKHNRGYNSKSQNRRNWQCTMEQRKI